MLTAHIDEVKNELVIDNGKVEENDIYPGGCCPGYDFEVALIFDGINPLEASVWGICGNPEHRCPECLGQEPCHYCGVQHFSAEDLALRLAESQVVV